MSLFKKLIFLMISAVGGERAVSSPNCSWLFEVQSLRLQQIQSWKEFANIPEQGLLLDLSRDRQYLTSFQKLRKMSSLPVQDQFASLKVLKKSVQAKFVRGAIINAQVGEFGAFSELVKRELHYLKIENQDSHEMQARLMVFARYKFSDFIINSFLINQGYNWEQVEALRKQYRLKPKPPPVVQLGSEQVLRGVEIGFFRLNLVNGRKRNFINSSSEFSAVDDLDPIFEVLKRDPSFSWDHVDSIDFFHNHPPSEVAPLSAADWREGGSRSLKITVLARRKIPFTIHAVQEINRQVIVFSSQDLTK